MSISEDQRAAMHAAVLGALPTGVYALEEMRYKAGSFYDAGEFVQHQGNRAVFAALGLHEWGVSQLWRHFRLVNITSRAMIRNYDTAVVCSFDDTRGSEIFRCSARIINSFHWGNQESRAANLVGQ